MTTPRDPTEDYPLIRRAQAGDIAARDALAEKHRGFIFSSLKKTLDHRDDFREFISVAYIKFFLAIKCFDIDRGLSLLTYASKAIEDGVKEERRSRYVIRVPKTNTILSQKNKDKLATAKKTVLAGDNESWMFARENRISPAEQCVNKSQIDDIKRAMQTMPENTRQSLIDRINGLTLNQIAQKNGKTREWARQRELAAIRIIRTAMDAAEPV